MQFNNYNAFKDENRFLELILSDNFPEYANEHQFGETSQFSKNYDRY